MFKHGLNMKTHYTDQHRSDTGIHFRSKREEFASLVVGHNIILKEISESLDL